MNIAIFGAGKAGKYLYSQIKINADDINVKAFIDNKLNGEIIDNITAFNSKTFFDDKREELDVDTIIIAAGAQKTLKYMINTCVEHGIANIYMMQDVAGKEQLPLFAEGKFDRTRIRKLRFTKEKPSLHYFEVPITDNCNLNCKGCLFACNAVKGIQHVPIEQLIDDARRMAELFYDVPWIRILGGEPLMHPNIVALLDSYRKYFPDTEIDLCTNGLLIPKMDDGFWDCIKRNRVSIHVSGYKPTYNILDRIDSILKDKGIVYTILKRDKFLKYYTDKPINDMKNSYDKCIASGCYELYRGRLFTCSGIIAFEHFNELFDMNYEIKENVDWSDIHKPDADGFAIKKLLESPSPICKYCDVDNMQEFYWDYSTDCKMADFLLS